LGVNPADRSLFIATHTGLYRLDQDAERAERVSDRYQDTMGFTVAGPNHFLGSGHPDLRDDLPPLLGLIESRDAGETWTPISLQGKVDFHALRVRGKRIVGYDATSGRVMTSQDRGRTWRGSRPRSHSSIWSSTRTRPSGSLRQAKAVSSGRSMEAARGCLARRAQASSLGRGATGSTCSTGAAAFGSAGMPDVAGRDEAESAAVRLRC
jgi:hypothetical protein